MLDHQDKYMMKAQVHVSKSSAISDIQALPRRKYLLLSSVTNGNPSRVNIKQLCGRGTNTLSWKPCQGGSSQIVPTCSQIQSPRNRSRWRYNLTPAESKFKTPHARSSR
nr:hypothetical protein [Tanacetum cinerariifolium]